MYCTDCSRKILNIYYLKCSNKPCKTIKCGKCLKANFKRYIKNNILHRKNMWVCSSCATKKKERYPMIALESPAKPTLHCTLPALPHTACQLPSFEYFIREVENGDCAPSHK